MTKGDITRLKQGEEEKRKRYTALCVTAKPVSKDILDRLEKLGEVQEQIMLIHTYNDTYIPQINLYMYHTLVCISPVSGYTAARDTSSSFAQTL